MTSSFGFSQQEVNSPAAVSVLPSLDMDIADNLDSTDVVSLLTSDVDYDTDTLNINVTVTDTSCNMDKALDLTDIPNTSFKSSVSLTAEPGFCPPLIDRYNYLPQPSPPIFSPLLKTPTTPIHLNLTSNRTLPPELTASVLSKRLSREYLPMPGSDSGVLLHLEQLGSLLRNIVFSTLPGPWADWVISNVSEKWLQKLLLLTLASSVIKWAGLM